MATKKDLELLRTIKVYAIDFDGTLCKHKFPKIGKPNIRIINWVKQKRESGIKFILWTCRSGEELDKALKWCERFNLEWDAVNEDIPELKGMFPSTSPKVYAQKYIDDKNICLKDIK